MPHFMWLTGKSGALSPRYRVCLWDSYGTQRAVVYNPERQSSLVLRTENKERAAFCVLMKGLQ